jgi:hypothetical protein
MPDLSTIQIHQSLIIVVPALLIIGHAFKQTPKFPDWAIVWLMILLGVLAGIGAIGFNLNGIANGVIAAGMAITANQAYKQTFRKR